MTEADFQRQIVDLAHVMGYRVAHFRPAMTSKGWRTPVSADGAGFPDLILINPIQRRLIAIECKANGRKPTAQQREWLDLFDMVAESHVFQAGEIEQVEEILRPR